MKESNFERDGLPAQYIEGSGVIGATQDTLMILNLLTKQAVSPMDRRDAAELTKVADRIKETGSCLRSIDGPQLQLALNGFDSPLPRNAHRNGSDRNALRVEIIKQVDEVRGGFLERYETRWVLIPKALPSIMALIIKIDRKGDHLVAENHNLRHYHYCNWKGLRTDVILTFDVENTICKKPLFWEKHGEGKAKGRANAPSWKERKRRSIYDAVSPELKALSLDIFRRPSNRAENVWPLNVKLTKRPEA